VIITSIDLSLSKSINLPISILSKVFPGLFIIFSKIIFSVLLILNSLFNFVGDPINNMVGEETSDEERVELRETLGLTDPIYIQFSRFVGNASKGNFGISYQLKRPVSELI